MPVQGLSQHPLTAQWKTKVESHSLFPKSIPLLPYPAASILREGHSHWGCQ